MTRIVEAKTVFGAENQHQVTIEALPHFLRQHKVFHLIYTNNTHRPYINKDCQFVDVINNKLTFRFCKKIKTLNLLKSNHLFIIDNTIFEIV